MCWLGAIPASRRHPSSAMHHCNFGAVAAALHGFLTCRPLFLGDICNIPTRALALPGFLHVLALEFTASAQDTCNTEPFPLAECNTAKRGRTPSYCSTSRGGWSSPHDVSNLGVKYDTFPLTNGSAQPCTTSLSKRSGLRPLHFHACW